MPFFIPAFFAAFVSLAADHPARSLAGRRPSWLDGAPVAMASGGGALGSVAGLEFAEDGQVMTIIVHRAPSGPDYAIPRSHIHVIDNGTPVHIVVDLDRDELANLPIAQP